MPTTQLPAPTPDLQALDCDVFCRVVDNFGDAAVCWRLARSLALEQGFATRLIIDRLEELSALQPGIDSARPIQDFDRVRIVRADHFVEAQTGNAGGRARVPAIAIDAFGGGLPELQMQALAARSPRGLLIVLEYLSAEDWVGAHHRLASPHPTLPVRRRFFFPGFTADTGGLLRERGLIEARRAFQADRQARADFWRSLGHAEPTAVSRVVSLFGYATPSLPAMLPALLDAMAEGAQPTVLALAPGPLALASREWLVGRGQPLAQGAAPWHARVGALELRALPFLAQPDYDRLLWSCDLNLVRGEDSLVRALWAGSPLVWQLYPQDGHAHCAKLEAFLARWRSAGDGAPGDRAALDRLDQFHRIWNGCARPAAAAAQPIGTAWTDLLAALPALAPVASRFCDDQAGLPDLAAALAAFCREQLK